MLSKRLFETLLCRAMPPTSMSSVRKRRIDEWWYRGLPGYCCFCLGLSEALAPWCESCLEALPWNFPSCPSCCEPQSGDRSGVICKRCIDAPPGFDLARVPLRYEASIATLIQHFKFDASPRAGNLLVELVMVGLSRGDVTLPDALMAVPLHPVRARQRGFDQGCWLGRQLSARLGVKLLSARRHRDTPTQRVLNRLQRQGNLSEAFVVSGRLPSKVALIDDVMTTGATLDALARSCRLAGAEHVEAWALARTPLFDRQREAIR